jgi:poly(A) polymerase
MQPRFERRTVTGATSLIAQVRFRAGYDFLRLRADCGDVPTELADWWEDFHLGSDDDREAMLQDLRSSSHSKPRRVPAAAADPGAAPDEPAEAEGEPEASGDATSAPRKRRRRRRRPAGGGEGAAPAAS